MAKSILVSCGARLAVFDIEELREITACDELHLDTIGEKRTTLFLIMSDTDTSFNFLISIRAFQPSARRTDIVPGSDWYHGFPCHSGKERGVSGRDRSRHH